MRLDHPRLSRQAGVYHVSQARECGLTRNSGGGYAGSRVLPGVYSVLPAPLSVRARLFAALLFADPDARLTGLTAAGQLGWRMPLADEPVDVLIPHSRRIASTSFVVVTRTRFEGCMTRLGLAIALPTAILLGCARQLSYRELTAVVACALQRREASLPQLRKELLAHPTRPGSHNLTKALTELRGGAESIKELDTLKTISRLGLPAPQCQMWIFDLLGNLICIADFYWEGVVATTGARI